MAKTTSYGADKSTEGAIKGHMTKRSTNEMIVKGSLGIDENAEFWVVEDLITRNKCLEAARKAGVKRLGGKPIEQFFIMGRR